jgi:hypothetical protein
LLAHPFLLPKISLSFQSLDRSKRFQNNVCRKHQETWEKIGEIMSSRRFRMFPLWPKTPTPRQCQRASQGAASWRFLGRTNQQGVTSRVVKSAWLVLSTFNCSFFLEDVLGDDGGSGICQVGEG